MNLPIRVAVNEPIGGTGGFPYFTIPPTDQNRAASTFFAQTMPRTESLVAQFNHDGPMKQMSDGDMASNFVPNVELTPIRPIPQNATQYGAHFYSQAYDPYEYPHLTGLNNHLQSTNCDWPMSTINLKNGPSTSWAVAQDGSSPIFDCNPTLDNLMPTVQQLHPPLPVFEHGNDIEQSLPATILNQNFTNDLTKMLLKRKGGDSPRKTPIQDAINSSPYDYMQSMSPSLKRRTSSTTLSTSDHNQGHSQVASPVEGFNAPSTSMQGPHNCVDLNYTGSTTATMPCNDYLWLVQWKSELARECGDTTTESLLMSMEYAMLPKPSLHVSKVKHRPCRLPSTRSQSTKGTKCKWCVPCLLHREQPQPIKHHECPYSKPDHLIVCPFSAKWERLKQQRTQLNQFKLKSDYFTPNGQNRFGQMKGTGMSKYHTCPRCLHHGLHVALKNHKCPFLTNSAGCCNTCDALKSLNEVTSKQTNLRRKIEEFRKFRFCAAKAGAR